MLNPSYISIGSAAFETSARTAAVAVSDLLMYTFARVDLHEVLSKKGRSLTDDSFVT